MKIPIGNVEKPSEKTGILSTKRVGEAIKFLIGNLPSATSFQDKQPVFLM
jgi:hypothetical protein